MTALRHLTIAGGDVKVGWEENKQFQIGEFTPFSDPR